METLAGQRRRAEVVVQRAAFQRFDYDFVCAILLCIIGMIMVGEVLATWVRGVFLERGRVDGQ